MARININICLSDIPKDLIRKAGNGKSYINLNIGELKQTDERGNNHYVSIYIPEEFKNQYPDKIFIGRGRELHFEPRPVDDLPENETGLPF